jgi:serine/threonine protein kinase
MRRMPAGTEINNQVSGATYRILEFLGEGGFGAAYAAFHIDEDGDQDGDVVCLKFTNDADVWHGEAFFAGILREMNNVVTQRGAFPTMIVDGRSTRMVFVIEMDFMETGTVRDACMDGRLPWPEDRVVRKIRGLLQPLSLLHNMGVSHRDITPGNVYVANRAVLKLGDFGITKAGFKKSGVRADMAAWPYAPSDIGSFWRPADDVYQVGLLMLTLLAGEEVDNTVGKVDVNQLTSRGYGLRVAIKQAISTKAKRPQTASDLSQLLPVR